jgi:hypothetical protein
MPPHSSGGMYGTGYCDYFFSAGAGAAAGASAAAGAAAGASAAAGAGAAAFGASFFWQPMSTARKAVRNTIFFMIKSPNVCGCGRIARRGIIQRHYPLPSGYLENKYSIAYMWDWALAQCCRARQNIKRIAINKSGVLQAETACLAISGWSNSRVILGQVTTN